MSTRSHKISKVKSSYVHQVEHVSLNLDRALLVSGQHFKLSLSILSKGSKPPHPPPWEVMKGVRKSRLCMFLFRLAKVKTLTPQPHPPPYATRRRIYDIGIEFLNFYCFATKRLKSFCKSMIFSGICSIFCVLSFCSIKTWFKALWDIFLENLHATLDSQLIKYFAQKAPAGIFNGPFN